MCTTLPPVLVTDPWDREARPDVRRPRGFPPAAAALGDRGADEPVHVALDRRDPRRRPAGVPRRPAGRRPHARARGRGRPAGAALHPLQRLPQRLPGLLAHRRPRLRLRLPGADRRDPGATAPRCRPGAVAAVRVEPLRRLLRGLPGQDRHPERASPPAGEHRSRRAATGASGCDERSRLGVFGGRRRFALGTAARARSPSGRSFAARRSPPARAARRAGRARGISEPVARESFRDWWKEAP